jgi:hypothetical protein
MAWIIIGDCYINLDAVSMVQVTEEDGKVIVTFYKHDGMILEQVEMNKQWLQQLYRVLAYTTKAVPVGLVELPQTESEVSEDA